MNIGAVAKSGFGRQVDFVLMAAGWYFFGALFQTVRPGHGAILGWVLLASGISMLALGSIRYFERHVPKSDLSGPLSLFLVLPLAALLSRGLLSWAAHAPPISVAAALRASVWVVLAFEASQWAMHKLNRKTENGWDLKTLLLPEERDGLSAQIEESGASGWIKTRPCAMDAEAVAALQGDETLVISRGAAHNLKDCSALLNAHLRGQRIVDLTELLREIRGRVRLSNADAWSFLLGSTYQSPSIRFYFLLKTALEPFLAALLILLFSPLLIAVGLAVAVTSGRPILYRQERLGYRGRPFFLMKFRTMSVTAEGGGATWAKVNDARVTPLGLFLRKSHLDELPQLFNVLRRQVSFVGPRPERPEFYKMLEEEIPLFSLRLLVRPGITGWAQSKQSYAGSTEESKIKLEYDLYYVQNMSPIFDLQVAIDTVGLLLRGNGGR